MTNGAENSSSLLSRICLSLVSKAESSDKKLNRYFHEPIGVKEHGFENRRTFSKKAREPQNHYAKQCVFVCKLPNRCEKD